MKKIFYVFAVLFVIGLTSCSSDDDNVSADIIGKWDITQMTMEGSFTEDGMSINFKGVSKNITGDNHIVFNEDNTLTGESSEFEIEMEYEIFNQTITVTIPAGSNIPHTGTWEKNGNKLVLHSDTSDETVEYTIEELTSSKMFLSADESAMDLGEDFPEISNFSVTITFNR